jgi:hypothetical protein
VEHLQVKHRNPPPQHARGNKVRQVDNITGEYADGILTYMAQLEDKEKHFLVGGQTSQAVRRCAVRQTRTFDLPPASVE